MFYLNSTLIFGIPTVLVFHLEVYNKVDRLLTGLTAQQKGATARWYSNKTSLVPKVSVKKLIPKTLKTFFSWFSNFRTLSLSQSFIRN